VRQHQRRQEVDRALHDGARVGRPQPAEPVGADRLDEGIEPQAMVVEPVPVEEGQHLVHDACPVLEVELQPSNVPGERLEGGGQREQRLVPAPGCPLERVVPEYEPLPRVTAHVEPTPADRRGQELTQIDLVVDPVPDQLHLIGQVVLPDQGGQLEVPTGGGAGSVSGGDGDVVRVWRKRMSPASSASTMARITAGSWSTTATGR
jgi:hypothetical protein